MLKPQQREYAPEVKILGERKVSACCPKYIGLGIRQVGSMWHYPLKWMNITKAGIITSMGNLNWVKRTWIPPTLFSCHIRLQIVGALWSSNLQYKVWSSAKNQTFIKLKIALQSYTFEIMVCKCYILSSPGLCWIWQYLEELGISRTVLFCGTDNKVHV